MDALEFPTSKILLGFLVVILALYSTPVSAYFIGHQTINYGHGYRGHPGPYYKTKVYRPYYTVGYWSRWTYVGYGCRSQCLIDRNTGQVITCNRSCAW